MSMASALQLAVTGIRQFDYTGVIIISAIGYDYTLTFSKEIEYIWNKPWSWVSTLFILVRYFGLCFLIIFAFLGSSFLPGPAETCDILYTVGIWATMMFFASADLVMILRVWALYKRSRLVLGALLTLYAVEVIITLVNCIIVSTQNESLASIAQVLDYSYCVIQYGSPLWSEIMDSAQIALGVSMCLLVTIQFIIQSFQMYKATKRFHINPYINLLGWEGMVYFLAVLAYGLIDIMWYIAIVPTNGWWILLTVIPQSIPAVTLVPRFILNLRELYARDAQGKNNIDTAFGIGSAFNNTALTDIVFAEAGQNERPEENEEVQMEERERLRRSQ